MGLLTSLKERCLARGSQCLGPDRTGLNRNGGQQQGCDDTAGHDSSHCFHCATTAFGVQSSRASSSRNARQAAGRFTDDPIRPGVTPVKTIHFTELRMRIDALRRETGLAPFPWTAAALTTGVTVGQAHASA